MLLEQGLTAVEAQALINHVHVHDLFSYSEAADDETASYLADVLRDPWTAKLRQEHPGSTVRVEIDPGISDPQVVVFNP